MTALCTGITVRVAKHEDVPAIHAIEVGSFADPWQVAAFRDLITHGRAHVEVAEDQARAIVGYSVSVHAADEAEIANLAVAAAARRRGIATALLRNLVSDAKRRGAKSIFLEVRESNVAARRLYAAHGFTEVGRRSRYYQKPVEDALLMRKDL
jgi:ribosomal-protein-alanine N-acetyltransferase